MATNDKQVIFSLVGVGKVYPPKRQVLRDIYLGFYYGAKIGVLLQLNDVIEVERADAEVVALLRGRHDRRNGVGE